ncbi:MAG: hypothetical protein AB7H43_00175 [Acidimicrobiia bacterium]
MSRRRAVPPGGTADLSGWIWPAWLERQLDPASPAHAPDQPLPGATNVTARSWTSVGNLDSALVATVDGHGLVTGPGAGWSLDWWVGADDRWHLPSREPAVRQRLLEGAPVVETSMRVPSGDAVHRVHAVREGGHELVVVEVENRSPAPVALALAVRPYDGRSLVAVGRIELVDGTTVVVDGRPALFLPRPPNRAAGSTAAGGDVASVVTAGAAGDRFGAVDDPDGLATAAFVWPLPHRSALRVAMPLSVPMAGPGWIGWRRRPGRGREGVGPRPDLAGLPAGARVANGWKAHGAGGLRLVLPDDRLAEGVAATRQHLRAGTDRPPADLRAATWLPGALDRFGLGAEVAGRAARYPEALRLGGGIGLAGAGSAGEGAALHALAEHWRLHRDRPTAVELVPTVAAVAGALAAPARRHRGDLGSPWRLAGLLAAAELLGAAGEVRGAADARGRAEAARAGLAVTGSDDALAACWQLRLVGPDDPRVRAARSAVGARLDGDLPAGAGLDARAAVELALVEVEAGDRRALDRLAWLLEVATPTWTWPTTVHPRLRSGSAGDGDDVVVAAGLLLLVRQLLVRERPAGLTLVGLVPEAWLGRGLEVHDAPTTHGLLSYALRWHGDRPALLWELAPHEGAGVVVLTAPGLDPSWSSAERSGEALLAPVPVPAAATRVGLSPRRR